MEHDTLHREASVPTMPPTVAEGTKGAILVADDEAAVRESVADVLRDEGYQVTAAPDGTAALEAIEGHEFDLVLSDLRMPGADGLTVLRRVREVSPQTLVLLMTAHATVDTAIEALQRGAQDYLLKPLIFEDVLHKIDHLLLLTPTYRLGYVRTRFRPIGWRVTSGVTSCVRGWAAGGIRCAVRLLACGVDWRRSASRSW